MIQRSEAMIDRLLLASYLAPQVFEQRQRGLQFASAVEGFLPLPGLRRAVIVPRFWLAGANRHTVR